MRPSPIPELSVVVPLLNEAQNLHALFQMLAAQKEVPFEVLLCDGGSTDGTLDLLEAEIEAAPFPCRVIKTAKGRGRQMNAGARASRGGYLLFLHADSLFTGPHALRRALDALTRSALSESGGRVAGRFALQFRTEGRRASAAFYFLEWKARLDRPECIHGDQGMLISRSFFEEVGTFEESLPFFEDAALARAVGRRGKWILFPEEIQTSARRFEAEGLLERQLLNAVIVNLFVLGWVEALREMPEVYRSQDRVGRLRLLPFFQRIGSLVRGLPLRERLDFWYRTGGHVRANAWQLAFALDACRSYRRGVAPGQGRTSFLCAFEGPFAFLTDNPPGRWAAAVLVRVCVPLAMVWRALAEA